MAEYRKTVKDINVKGKFVMVRCGLDVPLDPKKDLLDPERVTDDTRIRDIIPALQYLIGHGSKIILAAGWCGRPKAEDPDYSMAPVAKRLEQILAEKGVLKHKVLIAPDCFKDRKPRSVYKNRGEVRKIIGNLKEGQAVVLENVRYDPEANMNDKSFADFFASLAEIYVNENEVQNHREEATVVTVPVLIAKKGGEVVYGLKYVGVLNNIGDLKRKLENPGRGFFVLGLCGKKIESEPGITSKITVARGLMDKMRRGDTLLIGGAVTYTFILAQHYASRIKKNLGKVNKIVEKYDRRIVSETKNVEDKEQAAQVTDKLQKRKSDELKVLLGIEDKEIKELVGDSYIRWGQEGEQFVYAYNVLCEAKAKGIGIIAGYDHIITNKLPDKSGTLPNNAEIKVHKSPINIPKGWLAVAEGPKTLKAMAKKIEKAGIYLQSGPFSIEDKRVELVSKTDHTIFNAVRKCKAKGGITIGAGGDTVARMHRLKAENAFSIITSAGGATLELIETGTSKGKEAVEEAQSARKT